ncbi:hypothetical protein [Streptomyces sp. NPDC050704]|uniref:hypothetical protein n=1 Tax=Streptomyces sp. NPDC050704 TaxID=3157219 RepID=UPI00343EB1F9
MRPKLPTRTRTGVRTRFALTASAVTLLAGIALVGGLAPQAAAVQPALPLPLPVAAVEPLVTEGVTVEGPLVNNLTLPTLK